MSPRAATFLLLLTGLSGIAREESPLPLPPRPSDAPTGSAFAASVSSLDLAQRDREILAQVTSGNVPGFWRSFVEVKVEGTSQGTPHRASYWVAPDYLAVGSEQDYFLAPVAPSTAQAITDALGCVLPTRRMVDDIYRAAAVKLAPAPMTPGALMTTVGAFREHNTAILAQRASFLNLHPPGALVAGHKKDVVITAQVPPGSPKVAIYGWHRRDGIAIQPLYAGHTADWVDYSHGIRLVRQAMSVDGAATTINAVLADPALAHLLSDEGPILAPRYAPAAVNASVRGEQTEFLNLDPGVRVMINSPVGPAFDPARPTRLILYALPNGNSIEQTAGRLTQPGDDWHFEIQHIAAQTRWLRAHVHDANLIVAYLECAEKSWPAWRRKNDPDNRAIPNIVAELQRRFEPSAPKVILTGHSGGGTFTFGFLNGVEAIPDFVERIAFLDSNYAYDSAQAHDAKLANWLNADSKRYLCVLAYNDALGLLDGKPFVSASGGTWGRSHAMLDDLSRYFSFTAADDPDVQRRFALGGRVKFFLRENPTRAIFHTRMVELNGFIHAMLSGTSQEEQGYVYLGPRAYSDSISAE